MPPWHRHFFKVADRHFLVTAAHILDSFEPLQKSWRFHTPDRVCLPDYSADSIIVAGYPSIRAKFDGKDLRGRLFVLKSRLHVDTPKEVRNSEDPITPGIDFFVQHKDAMNEITGENVSRATLRAMSGCSIVQPSSVRNRAIASMTLPSQNQSAVTSVHSSPARIVMQSAGGPNRKLYCYQAGDTVLTSPTSM